MGKYWRREGKTFYEGVGTCLVGSSEIPFKYPSPRPSNIRGRRDGREGDTLPSSAPLHLRPLDICFLPRPPYASPSDILWTSDDSWKSLLCSSIPLGPREIGASLRGEKWGLRCPAGNAIRFPLTGKCMRTLGNCCNAAPYLAVAQFHLNKRHSPSLHFLSLLLKYLPVRPGVRCVHLSHMLFDWTTRTPCLRTVGRVDLT